MEFHPVPMTLCQVGQQIAEDLEPGMVVKHFIDRVIHQTLAAGGRRPDGTLPIPAEMIADEPPFIEDKVRRVHIAGISEYLSGLAGIVAPEWTNKPIYFLPEPRTSGATQEIRDMKFKDTPPAFARRNLFCGPTLALSKLTALLNSAVTRTTISNAAPRDITHSWARGEIPVEQAIELTGCQSHLEFIMCCKSSGVFDDLPAWEADRDT